MMTKFSNLNLEQGFNMHRARCNAVFLFLFLVFSVVATGSNSASAKEKIAVIDLGFVLSKSTAMRTADKQIAAMEAAYKKEKEAKEISLRDEEQKLRQQRAIITPESFSQKRENFSKRVRAHQISVRQKAQQFVATRLKAVETLEKAMEPVVSKIANKVGADVIVERKRTFFTLKSLDISKSVLVELNKALPTIKIKLVELPKK